MRSSFLGVHFNWLDLFVLLYLLYLLKLVDIGWYFLNQPKRRAQAHKHHEGHADAQDDVSSKICNNTERRVRDILPDFLDNKWTGHWIVKHGQYLKHQRPAQDCSKGIKRQDSKDSVQSQKKIPDGNEGSERNEGGNPPPFSVRTEEGRQLFKFLDHRYTSGRMKEPYSASCAEYKRKSTIYHC